MTDETMQSVFTFVANEFLHPVRKMLYISLEMNPKNGTVIPTSWNPI